MLFYISIVSIYTQQLSFFFSYFLLERWTMMFFSLHSFRKRNSRGKCNQFSWMDTYLKRKRSYLVKFLRPLIRLIPLMLNRLCGYMYIHWISASHNTQTCIWCERTKTFYDPTISTTSTPLHYFPFIPYPFPHSQIEIASHFLSVMIILMKRTKTQMYISTNKNLHACQYNVYTKFAVLYCVSQHNFII